jgi:hypothetical protein
MDSVPSSPILKNSWVTEAKRIEKTKTKKPFQFEIYIIPF